MHFATCPLSCGSRLLFHTQAGRSRLRLRMFDSKYFRMVCKGRPKLPFPLTHTSVPSSMRYAFGYFHLQSTLYFKRHMCEQNHVHLLLSTIMQGLLGSLIFAVTISYIDEPVHQDHFLYQGNFLACKLAAWLVVAGASATVSPHLHTS